MTMEKVLLNVWWYNLCKTIVKKIIRYNTNRPRTIFLFFWDTPHNTFYVLCWDTDDTYSVSCVKRGTAHFTCLHCHYLFSEASEISSLGTTTEQIPCKCYATRTFLSFFIWSFTIQYSPQHFFFVNSEMEPV